MKKFKFQKIFFQRIRRGDISTLSSNYKYLYNIKYKNVHKKDTETFNKNQKSFLKSLKKQVTENEQIRLDHYITT